MMNPFDENDQIVTVTLPRAIVKPIQQPITSNSNFGSNNEDTGIRALVEVADDPDEQYSIIELIDLSDEGITVNEDEGEGKNENEGNQSQFLFVPQSDHEAETFTMTTISTGSNYTASESNVDVGVNIDVDEASSTTDTDMEVVLNYHEEQIGELQADYEKQKDEMKKLKLELLYNKHKMEQMEKNFNRHFHIFRAEMDEFWKKQKIDIENINKRVKEVNENVIQMQSCNDKLEVQELRIQEIERQNLNDMKKRIYEDHCYNLQVLQPDEDQDGNRIHSGSHPQQDSAENCQSGVSKIESIYKRNKDQAAWDQQLTITASSAPQNFN